MEKAEVGRYGAEGGVARQKKFGQKSFASSAVLLLLPDRQPKNTLQPRLLSLPELRVTMANFSRPVASAITGVDFNVYSNEDVKAISVKRIHNTPTLDSFNNPVPGGLYDPALGAWGDHV